MFNFNTKLGRLVIGLLLAGYLGINVACGVRNKYHTKVKTPIGKTYVLLFGGGTSENDDLPVFYNSIELMYKTFAKQKVEDIKVFYTGKQPDISGIVQGDATEENIMKMLKEFSNNLNKEDTLIIYRTGHESIIFDDKGRMTNESAMALYGYRLLKKDRYQKDKFITSDELKERLKSIKATKLLLLHQCRAGDFANITNDLERMIVMASSDKSLPSAMWKTKKIDDFTLYIATAISGELGGKSISADTDYNRLVSVREMFDFAINNMPASTIGFVHHFRNAKYIVLKDVPLMKWSVDIDPYEIFLGDYSYKDVGLSHDTTLDLRKNFLELIKYTLEKGEYDYTDDRLGEVYSYTEGRYKFDVRGRFPMSVPRNIKDFVPLKTGLAHNLEIDSVTNEVRKQEIFIDGTENEGCDGWPDVYLLIEKYRDEKGELVFNHKTLPIDAEAIRKYKSLVDILLPPSK